MRVYTTEKGGGGGGRARSGAVGGAGEGGSGVGGGRGVVTWCLPRVHAGHFPFQPTCAYQSVSLCLRSSLTSVRPL